MAGTIVPAVAATVAAGAYLNAKLKLSQDVKAISDFTFAGRSFEKRRVAGKGNLFYKLEEHAFNPKRANEIFLIFEGKSWTFRQYYDIVLRYAGWLSQTHKVVAGEIVALDFMNCPAFLILTLALWSLGASPAFINHNLTSKPLIHSVKVSTARLLIIDPELVPRALTDETQQAFNASNFRNNTFPLETVVLEHGLQSSLNYFPPYRAPDAARAIDRPSSIANLMYTSGTTGLPKAAIVSWGRMGAIGDLGARTLNLRSVDKSRPDRFYTSMPLYHTTAFTLGFILCLASATTFVVSRKFSVSKFWDEVDTSKVTIIQDKNHNVRMAFGNGLRPDVWATWNINRNDFTNGAIGSYGKVMERMSLKSQAIVEVDWVTEKPWRDPKTGLCQRVPRGDVGELLFMLDPATLKERFTGYLNNEEASNSKIVRSVLTDGDAYFRTGDVVRFDREGRLWFSDRIGDTFRWKSENVSTAEVGEVLGHHRAVLEANVYGVEVPGHEGRAGCAAILLHDNALQDGSGGVDVRSDVLASLATHATNSLPKYAVPLFLRVVREMMITGNNKQQKTELRKQGINLTALQQAGSRDRIYWLRPGSDQYVAFDDKDLKALEQSKTRL